MSTDKRQIVIDWLSEHAPIIDHAPSNKDIAQLIDRLTGDAIGMIDAERQRQVAEEGWSSEHDDRHDRGELAAAAACYAMPPYNRLESRPPTLWRWDARWWKPTPGNRVRELVKAGALIVAEIERIQRAKESEAG